MKRILISLSAGAALLFGTVSAFSADGIGIGVALSGARISASGTEVETGSQTAETNAAAVHNNTAIGSIFAEYTKGWLTVGLDYVPVDADVSDKTKTRNDTETSTTASQTAETSTARTQSAQAQISDHLTAYVEVGSAAYLKAGYVQVTVDTQESLGTGSTYGNADLDGVLLGVGYKGDWGSNGFYKLEGTYTNYDSLSITSGVARTGVTTNNKITADLDVSQIKLGVGVRF